MSDKTTEYLCPFKDVVLEKKMEIYSLTEKEACELSRMQSYPIDLDSAEMDVDKILPLAKRCWQCFAEYKRLDCTKNPTESILYNMSEKLWWAIREKELLARKKQWLAEGRVEAKIDSFGYLWLCRGGAYERQECPRRWDVNYTRSSTHVTGEDRTVSSDTTIRRGLFLPRGSYTTSYVPGEDKTHTYAYTKHEDVKYCGTHCPHFSYAKNYVNVCEGCVIKVSNLTIK